MNTTHYLIAADGTVTSFVVGDDGMPDCGMCRDEMRKHAGHPAYVSVEAARAGGRGTCNDLTDITRAGSTGFVGYESDNEGSERFYFWSGGPYPFPHPSQEDGLADWERELLAGAEPTSTPEPSTPERVIPRTSDEAAMLRRFAGSLDASPTQLLSALDTLALMLPGGRAERSGRELAETKSLCEVYERTVCPTLGWAPRPGMGYVNAPEQFLRSIEGHERTNATVSMATSIVRFAERYARGDVINEAILDSMETSLEDHKRPAANQVLEALGMDTLESREPQTRDFEVSVRVQRTIEIEVEQLVYVTVTATDEDEASELATDDYYLLADRTDDYGWTDGDGQTHYAYTGSGDIHEADVEEVEEV